jgi:uncharacterized protein (DUF885 family)
MNETRTPTAVDALADRYLDQYAAIDPLAALEYGLNAHHDAMPDLSPDGLAERSALRVRTLTELATAVPTDANDRITIAALRAELELAEELRAAAADESALNNITSPAQKMREVFDLMPTATADDWAIVARRLSHVPDAVHGYTASLRSAAARGVIAAQRQTRAVAAQCAQNADLDGFFARFAASAATDDGAPLPAAVRADLDRGAAAASAAYAGLASFLRDELLPLAPAPDAVGREVYTLHSRSFLGASIDLEEAYTWGQDELARIATLMAATAGRAVPGASTREAMEVLDNDRTRQISSTDALQAWMQDKSDAAVDALAGTHFDIPEPIRRLECLIAPTRTGKIYYTQPSENLITRPGRIWWSVPDGVTRFSTWRELSTVYHEGVPGHHLQIAQTLYRRDLLNRWRRIASWVSGHGEGWALYAERLMADLGFLNDPADYLGMLNLQSMRAARVVLDIGIHCQFDAPAEIGGGPWSYEKAWQFFTTHCARDEAVLRFELERYLGWPGQAPSYKIGERLWLQLREDARAREGAGFDLTRFHRRVLGLGSVGLDVLQAAVLGQFDLSAGLVSGRTAQLGGEPWFGMLAVAGFGSA